MAKDAFKSEAKMSSRDASWGGAWRRRGKDCAPNKLWNPEVQYISAIPGFSPKWQAMHPMRLRDRAWPTEPSFAEQLENYCTGLARNR